MRSVISVTAPSALYFVKWMSWEDKKVIVWKTLFCYNKGKQDKLMKSPKECRLTVLEAGE